MKTLITLLITFCFFHTFAQTINVYDDAVKYINQEISFEMLNNKYGPLEGNNYFNLENQNNKKGILEVQSTDSESLEKGILKRSFMNVNIAPQVDGLAIFLVSRAKKELSISFFNGFKNQISNKNYIDFQILFANTYEELNLVDEKVYDFQPYMQTLREKFKEDLDTVATSLQRVIKLDSTKIGRYLNKNDSLKVPVYAMIDLAVGLHNGNHIGSILEGMNYETENQSMNRFTFVTTLDLFRVLSFALRKEKVDEEYYISQTEMDALLAKNDLLRVFLGLTAAVAKVNDGDVKFSESAFDLLNSKAEDVSVFKNIIKNYKDGASMLINGGKTDSTKFHTYFKGCSKLLSTLALLNDFNSDKLKNKNQALLFSMVKGSEMIHSLKAKEYTRAVNLLTSILLTSGFKGSSAKVARFIGKYGVFMGQIADAKTSDQVQESLEYFAAPVGSWRDKSRDKFSLAVDSFVGFGMRTGPDSTRNFLSTPVGLSFNFSPLRDNSISLSLLTSFIDLGAITSFRFKDNTTALAPIFLKQIVAPGAFFAIHHKKTPLFLNLGFQKSSIINSISPDGTTNQLTSNWRFSCSINVNIPITYILKR